MAFIILVGGAAGVLAGGLRFLDGLRTRIAVTGTAEVVHEGRGHVYEAFVLYVRTSGNIRC